MTQQRFDLGPPSSPAPAFEGTVAGIRFENDESGFRVLRVDVDLQGGGSRQEAWAGVCPSVTPGMRVRATGTYEDNSRFGRQLKIGSLVPVLPSTSDGIERFLGSGQFSGIGPLLAKRIVAQFGNQTIKVLDEDPGRLAGVKGVGPKVLAALTATWTEKRAIADIMVFLQAHGASPALAARIHRRFGDEAVQVVREQPYRLAIEVDGVGFLTADRIALSAGINPDSPDRAGAALLHVLHEQAREGHCWTSTTDLLDAAAELISRPARVCEEPLERLSDGGHVRIEVEHRAVYLRRLHEAEHAVAQRVAALHLTQALGERNLTRCVTAAVKEFERGGRQLHEAQRAAIELAAASKVVVITGGPGVGKSTILRALLAMYDEAQLTVSMAAPTGRAAKRMSEATGQEAKTIHRLLEVDPVRFAFRRDAQNKLDAQVIVLDESTMVDTKLARDLLVAVSDGARLVLIGDVDQLPSVGPGSVLRDIIESGTIPTARLTHIFRQAAGSEISENAARINRGISPELGGGGEFETIERDGAEAAADVLALVTERIPRLLGIHASEVQTICPMYKGECGVTALNAMLQQAINPPGDSPEVRRGQTIYRRGDRVMQLKNDYNKDVYNGDVGKVVEVEDDAKRSSHALTVEMNGKRVVYGTSDLEHLTLAYACTVHKLQGSEAPAVVVVMNSSHWIMLSRNILYTAITRGKRHVALVTTERALKVALGETRKEARRTGLAGRLQAALLPNGGWRAP